MDVQDNESPKTPSNTPENEENLSDFFQRIKPTNADNMDIAAISKDPILRNYFPDEIGGLRERKVSIIDVMGLTQGRMDLAMQMSCNDMQAPLFYLIWKIGELLTKKADAVNESLAYALHTSEKTRMVNGQLFSSKMANGQSALVDKVVEDTSTGFGHVYLKRPNILANDAITLNMLAVFLYDLPTESMVPQNQINKTPEIELALCHRISRLIGFEEYLGRFFQLAGIEVGMMTGGTTMTNLEDHNELIAALTKKGVHQDQIALLHCYRSLRLVISENLKSALVISLFEEAKLGHRREIEDIIIGPTHVAMIITPHTTRTAGLSGPVNGGKNVMEVFAISNSMVDHFWAILNNLKDRDDDFKREVNFKRCTDMNTFIFHAQERANLHGIDLVDPLTTVLSNTLKTNKIVYQY